MKIQKMFKKDINRDINGVIKVSQDDNKSLSTELEEYIVTKELERHFKTFLDNYSSALDYPTDKVGVWISGFFGSGKSHFLKILSYLLSNKEVDNKKAIDFFEDKFVDVKLYEKLVQSASVPTESILFNIDNEGPINKDKTAILRVFAKVFYNHLGFFGDDLKLAKLELFIDKKGKTNEFHQVFNDIHGDSWLASREAYAFFEDDVVDTLQKVLGMSDTAARNWFNGEENIDMSIKQLVADIKDYVEAKDGNFRLLFCIDEVGQYIGDDGNLMINLQTIVEELGTHCQGKVWVMVTSQEAIDSVVKIAGDDFSKIQGRFNTRLSLSSASVDEVIKKRILEKTDEAKQQLQLEYSEDYAVLRNLFTFSDAVSDMKGFYDSEEFVSTFPFVPYQFIVIQKVLAEIRKHGNSGKHLSGGERSMLSGFQEAAQKVQEADEQALVPFFRFYDTVHTFLESTIRRVIDRCQNLVDTNPNMKQLDVDVLKLLYLIRYIDDIKSNIDNISILMIDSIKTDKIKLRQEITESLERLERENYIARNGDRYYFLTDEEQDIAQEIRNTPVDSANIIQGIGQTIFSEIYPSKKFKYGKNGRYDFAYDQYIDSTLIGGVKGDIRLRFITVASDGFLSDENKILFDSRANNEAVVLLSTTAQYYNALESAAKIKKYVKKKNIGQLPEHVQTIIRTRQEESRKLEDEAKQQIEQAIIEGDFYAFGEKIEIKAGEAKVKIDTLLNNLIEDVYSELDLVNTFYESDADIQAVLNNVISDTTLEGTGGNNEFAIQKMLQWLDEREMSHIPVTMGDVQKRYQAIPYGWREHEIAGMIAQLIVAKKIEIRYAGAVVGADNRNLVNYLRRKSEIDRASVKRKVAPSEELLRKSAIFMREWMDRMSVPTGEEELPDFVVATLTDKVNHYHELLAKYKVARYPQKHKVEYAIQLLQDILSQKADSIALLTILIQKQDDLYDMSEDLEDIETFFTSQREIFDNALKLQIDMKDERHYLETSEKATDSLREIATILANTKPYQRIKELPSLIQEVKEIHRELLSQKKAEVFENIQECMAEVHTTADGDLRAQNEVTRADQYYTSVKEEVEYTTQIMKLDAMIRQLQNYTAPVVARIEGEIRQPEFTVHEDGNEIETHIPKITRVRRMEVFPVKMLSSHQEIDDYLDAIKQKLYSKLDTNDSIKIN